MVYGFKADGAIKIKTKNEVKSGVHPNSEYWVFPWNDTHVRISGRHMLFLINKEDII